MCGKIMWSPLDSALLGLVLLNSLSCAVFPVHESIALSFPEVRISVPIWRPAKP